MGVCVSGRKTEVTLGHVVALFAWAWAHTRQEAPLLGTGGQGDGSGDPDQHVGIQDLQGPHSQG